jgi:hypothetical protein
MIPSTMDEQIEENMWAAGRALIVVEASLMRYSTVSEAFLRPPRIATYRPHAAASNGAWRTNLVYTKNKVYIYY